MDGFPGILFHVDTGNSDSIRFAVVQRNIDGAVVTERFIILGNLVSFGKVRIEIILPGEPGKRADSASGGQPRFYCVLNGLAVENRQNARHSQTNRTGLRVCLSPVLVMT
ncbi:MAG: hypothetical protein MAGBODY4_01213 [Candidatus Marinimicrobia bacterium]|nr:hypothetical protein [Candidatus Neomarinimicrobiota bacterium]